MVTHQQERLLAAGAELPQRRLGIAKALAAKFHCRCLWDIGYGPAGACKGQNAGTMVRKWRSPSLRVWHEPKVAHGEQVLDPFQVGCR